MSLAKQMIRKVDESIKVNEIKVSGRIGISYLTKKDNGSINDRIVLNLRPETEKQVYFIMNLIKDSNLGPYVNVEEMSGHLIFITGNGKGDVSAIKKYAATWLAATLRKIGFTIISE